MRKSKTAVSCLNCPLRGCPGLETPEKDQLEFLDRFKDGEQWVEKGESVLEQGQRHPHLFTLLDGIVIRLRKMDDGRRQIVNIMFPGDLVGLQSAFDDESSHSVEALVDARLCVFSRDRFIELIGSRPRLGYDIIYMAAKQETELEEHLVSLGQRNARERVASLAVWLIERATATGMTADGNSMNLPLKQAQIADMLGLSLVHTNRTIKSLERDGLLKWQPGRVSVPDLDKAAEFAEYDRQTSVSRPYL